VSPYVRTVRTASGARAVQIDSAPLPNRPRGWGTCGMPRACLPGAGARAGRPIEIQAGAHTIIAADPYPTTSATPSSESNTTQVRTN
jgi:hypothetical protein